MKATKTTGPFGQTKTTFSVDDLGSIQTFPAEVLAAVATGRFDLNRAAQYELAARGLDKAGKWVGFPKAAAIHQVKL
jgi:hypothetical protein